MQASSEGAGGRTCQNDCVSTKMSEELHSENLRELAGQHGRADAVKLVATFAAGVAATLVASCLSSGTTTATDRLATWLLAAAVLMTISLMIFDRIVDPDIDATLVAAAHKGWSLKKTQWWITRAAVVENRKILLLLRRSLFVQLGFAAAAGATAAASLCV